MVTTDLIMKAINTISVAEKGGYEHALYHNQLLSKNKNERKQKVHRATIKAGTKSCIPRFFLLRKD